MFCYTYLQSHVVHVMQGVRHHGCMSQRITQLTDCLLIKTYRWLANWAWSEARTLIGSETLNLCIGNGALMLHSTDSMQDGPAWHATAPGLTPCEHEMTPSFAQHTWSGGVFCTRNSSGCFPHSGRIYLIKLNGTVLHREKKQFL